MSYWVHRRVTGKVPIAYLAAENAQFMPGRTSDFRHLGLWPLECDSTGELVIQPNQSNGDEENLNAETKGFLTNRTADRGGDHPDHRRDCNPDPVACTYCGERVVRGGVDPHPEHGSDFV